MYPEMAMTDGDVMMNGRRNGRFRLQSPNGFPIAQRFPRCAGDVQSERTTAIALVDPKRISTVLGPSSRVGRRVAKKIGQG